MKQTPFRIGLTGGIASGKSTVADMFAELGVAVIDTDVIAREVVRPGQPALNEIRERFGDDLIDASGTLDRTAMRKRIFANENTRRDLEAILHPRIGAETLRQADAAPGPYQLIVVPLLVGSALTKYVDRILVVDCEEELQIQRLLARDAETVEQARRILSAQASREARLAIADDVLLNERSLEETRQLVKALDEKYRRLAAVPDRLERQPETP
ncbi:MAG: dephospho-CoA kinase [Gammaproteobacteria bacterium]|nr:dephospho-CoA kinase [Gammaproteobacteria bacterium]NNC56620.1 dephospho-CoA kinase [Woeseiaceae bacterium]